MAGSRDINVTGCCCGTTQHTCNGNTYTFPNAVTHGYIGSGDKQINTACDECATFQPDHSLPLISISSTLALYRLDVDQCGQAPGLPNPFGLIFSYKQVEIGVCEGSGQIRFKVIDQAIYTTYAAVVDWSPTFIPDIAANRDIAAYLATTGVTLSSIASNSACNTLGNGHVN